MRFRRIGRSAGLAAILSFFVPGLGQAVSGAYRRAVVFAVPAVALALWALSIGPRGFLRGFLTPSFLDGLWWVNVASLVYHGIAVVDAYLVASHRARHDTAPLPSVRRATWVPRSEMAHRPSRRRSVASAGIALLGAAVIATVGVHGYVAAVVAGDREALAAVFNERPQFNPTATPRSLAPGETPPPATPKPSATPRRNWDWAADGKLTVLLMGIDRGPGDPGRMEGLRPDSTILVQVDTATGRAAMFSIPRNLVNVPLPPEVAAHYACRCWGLGLDGPPDGDWTKESRYFYALYQEAASTHPDWYSVYGPDETVRGISALEGAVGELAGVKVDGAVVIDLLGFIHLIDTLAPDGIEVNVPTELKDDKYPKLWEQGTTTLDIKAGLQRMHGETLLAYARSRHSTDDYDRSRRQELVLRSIRDEILHPCELLPRVPQLLDAVKTSLWTDLPIDAAPDLLALAEHIGTANTASYTLVPANYVENRASDIEVPEYLNPSSVADVRDLVAHSLDRVPAGIGGSGAGGGGGGIGINC